MGVEGKGYDPSALAGEAMERGELFLIDALKRRADNPELILNFETVQADVERSLAEGADPSDIAFDYGQSFVKAEMGNPPDVEFDIRDIAA